MYTPTLVIGNKNYSSWSLRPWFFMRKNGIEFEEHQLWLDVPAFKPAVEHYNSGGKVPVLLHQGLEIWDSLAIIEYVLEQFDCNYGWPTSRAARAHARSAVCEMHSSFQALRSECPMDIRRQHQAQLSDEAALDIQRVCQLWQQAKALSDGQGQWLYGRFSVADAVYAPVVFRLLGYAVDVTPQVRTYLEFVRDDSELGEWVEAARQETRHIEY